MNLKYKESIDEFKCKLTTFKEQERIAYRWVFNDINNPKNFLPPYIINSSRKKDNCKGYALSFFESHLAAKNRILEITKDKENLFKKLGNHIAGGKLEKTDGISDKENSFGHFDHFEYENINLKPKFEILEKVGSNND